MANDRISFNMESFERYVNTCSPEAIDFAASLGSDLEKMESKDLARFRASINKYREDCTCVRIPLPTKKRAEAIVGEVKGKVEVAKEKVAPTIEKIKVAVTPTIEAAREKARERITPKIEAAKRRLYY